MAVSGVRVRLQKDMSLPPPPRHEERTRPALDSTLADLGRAHPHRPAPRRG